MSTEEDLTKSGHTGVRWQAQMEEFLKEVRVANQIAGDSAVNDIRLTSIALIAQACAQGAIALAIANGLSDLEMAISRLTDQIGGANGYVVDVRFVLEEGYKPENFIRDIAYNMEVVHGVVELKPDGFGNLLPVVGEMVMGLEDTDPLAEATRTALRTGE